MSGREVSRPYHNIILIRGFSPLRAVFILGAKWKALARGWRRDCALCPKTVFYVFVFDSIDDSATMHNLSPVFFL